MVEGVGWVDDGSVVTSGGISAGIDMSLHLVSKLKDMALAEKLLRSFSEITMKLVSVQLLVLLVLLPSASFAFQHTQVREDGLVADFYYDAGATGQRPIIIFGGSAGGNFLQWNDRVIGVLKDLQKPENRGYALLALSYFDYDAVDGLPDRLKNIPIEYFKTAIDWLHRQPGIRKNGVAIYGTSRGAELALLLASRYPEVEVVIAAAPSAFVWGAYHREPIERKRELQTDPCAPAWTYRGRPIERICNEKTRSFTPWHDIVNTPDLVEQAVIPVEAMSAATLLLSGKYDDIWPSVKMSELIVRRLQQHDYRFAFQHRSYAASHDVFWVSWRDVLSFLREYYPASPRQ